MPDNTPLPNDHFQVLLYKFNKNLEGVVTNPMIANPGDHLQVLLYKATNNIMLYTEQNP